MNSICHVKMVFVTSTQALVFLNCKPNLLKTCRGCHWQEIKASCTYTLKSQTSCCKSSNQERIKALSTNSSICTCDEAIEKELWEKWCWVHEEEEEEQEEKEEKEEEEKNGAFQKPLTKKMKAFNLPNGKSKTRTKTT